MRRHHRIHYAFLILFILPFVLLVFSQVNKSATQTIRSQAQNAPAGIAPQTTVIATGLDVPWAIAFLPDGNIIFTERPGKVKLVPAAGGQVTDVGSIADVKASGEGGLLGIAVHPQFATNHFIYVYYTYGGTGGNTLNKVVRYTFTNNKLSAPTTIVDAIPGNSNHNGGRIKFAPDGMLYIATGDSQNPSLAQDQNALAGKILRVTDAGQPAPGNPFNNRTYSYGHRNPQGMAWNGTTMYETEHGDTLKDEVNVITPGKNYGWPTIQGDQAQAGLETPLANSGSKSWAPSGTAFFNGSVFFTGLRGIALFEATPNGKTATVKEHFKGQLGRIREAVVGPDNQLYITTSNRDGRGAPAADDDKILKVNFGTPSTSIMPSTGVPSFFPLAPCPSCVEPTQAIIPSQPVVSGGPAIPSATAPEPSIDPCQSSDVSTAEDNRRHKKHRGDISGGMEGIIQLLLKLLELFIQLLGGGQQLPAPNPTPEPSSILPDPCTSTVAP